MVINALGPTKAPSVGETNMMVGKNYKLNGVHKLSGAKTRAIIC